MDTGRIGQAKAYVLESITNMLKVPKFYKTYFTKPIRIYKNVRWRYTNRVSKEKHVFVLGAPRSGTTLIQTLIGAHPHFFSPGVETGFFTWQDIFHENRQHLGLPKKTLERFYAECSDIVEFFDKLAGYVTEDRERFVEKTPQHVLKVSYIQDHFPKSHIVHIHRDGRDCFCSAREAGIPRGSDLEEFAGYWKKCVASRLEAGGKILDVEYADLVGEPEEEMQKVMAFLDSSFELTQLQINARETDPRSGEEKFSRLADEISPRSVGRWKEELTSSELRRFDSIAEEELHAFGYEK